MQRAEQLRPANEAGGLTELLAQPSETLTRQDKSKTHILAKARGSPGACRWHAVPRQHLASNRWKSRRELRSSFALKGRKPFESSKRRGFEAFKGFEVEVFAFGSLESPLKLSSFEALEAFKAFKSEDVAPSP